MTSQLRHPNKQMETLNRKILFLEKTLKHQKQIHQLQTVPWKYLPRNHLDNDNSTLQETFNQQFKDLFLKHLDKIITSNTISLEIKTARQRELIQTNETTPIHSVCPSTPPPKPSNKTEQNGNHHRRERFKTKRPQRPLLSADTKKDQSTDEPMSRTRKRTPTEPLTNITKKTHLENHFLVQGPFPALNNT